jgi:DNA-binding LacI/PurR family transcriptional regulator
VLKLKDVAKDLGLSTSTVSRAMSGNGRVNAVTQQRVLAALEDREYTPNAIARSLRLRDAKSVGIIVPDITNSFYSSVIKGAELVCRRYDYSVLLCNSDENDAQEEDALQLMLEKQISGLILASVGQRAEKLGKFRSLHVPVVFIDNMPKLKYGFDSVSIDNRHAAYELTLRLIRRGYSQIGVISGPLGQSTGRMRLKGFEEAMRDNGLALRQEWLLEGDFKMRSGFECMNALLEYTPHPEAVVIANNYMAYGAVNAIRSVGCLIPEDIAIVAFDAEDATGLIKPEITSMNQPSDHIGAKAVEMLIARLTGEWPAGGESVVLEPRFREGNSW